MENNNLRIVDFVNEINHEDSIDGLMKVFQNVFKGEVPILKYIYGAHSKLIRCRINENHKNFNNVSELSYPPSGIIGSFGRANIPYQSMFYACSFPHDMETYPPRLVGLMESSAFYRNVNSIGRQRLTCSLWINKLPLNLIALPFSEKYEQACTDVSDIRMIWEKKKSSLNANGLQVDLLEYMGRLLADDVEDDKEYKVIASFVYFLLFHNDETKTADGILYPSVRAAGNSFNMALKPNVVDEKLKIVEGCVMHLIKDKDNASLAIYQHFDVKGDKILYRERTPNEKKIYNFLNRERKYPPLIN